MRIGFRELRIKSTQIFDSLGEFHLTGMIVLLVKTKVMMTDSIPQIYMYAGFVFPLDDPVI